MVDNKTYKVSDIKFRTRTSENDQAQVDNNLDAALLDIQNRIKDPSVLGVSLTAVIKGGDDVIDIAELSLKRNDDISEPSRLDYTVASWHHRVPESVNEVYDTLAGNLGMYYNDMTEPDDVDETMSIALGDPNAEIILTTRVENSESNFFADTGDGDDEDCDDGEC